MRLLLLAATVVARLAAGAHSAETETGAAAAALRVAALLPSDRTPLRLFPFAADFDDDSKVGLGEPGCAVA